MNQNYESLINKITHADCMDIMNDMPDKCIDITITDPPYGIGLKYNSYDDTLDNWFDLMYKFIPEIKRISKMVIFPCCRINALEWFYKNFPPDWIISWHKGSPGHSSYIGFNDWEPLIVYGKTKKQMHDFLTMRNDEKMGNYGHPCPKPVKWFRHFIIKASDNKKNIIFDPFSGSGSLACACHLEKFDFIAIEKDYDYWLSSCKRLDELRSQGTLF